MSGRYKKVRYEIIRAVLFFPCGLFLCSCSSNWKPEIKPKLVQIRGTHEGCGPGWKVNEGRERYKAKSVSYLLGLLNGSNANTRMEVLQELARIGSGEIAQQVVALLDDKDPGVRAAAACTIGDIGATKYKSDVARLLYDEDRFVRMASAYTVMKFSDTDGAYSVVDQAKSSDSAVFAKFFVEVHSKKDPKQLQRFLKHSNKNVRKCTAQKIAKMVRNGENSVSSGTLIEALYDSEPVVRIYTIWALTEMLGTDVIPRLAEMIEDDNEDVRFEVARALVRLGAVAYADQIVMILIDTWRQNNATSEIFKEFDKREIHVELAKHIDAADSRIREVSAKILISMKATEQCPRIAKHLKSTNKAVRIEATRILGKLQARKYSAEIADLLSDENDYVRISAIKSLTNLEAREQAVNIAKLLYDSDQVVREAAVRFLGRFSDGDYSGEIAGLVNDESISVRWEAMLALGKIGAVEYSSVISERLTDRHPFTRWIAVTALAEMRAADRVDDLRKLLEDPDESVRSAVRQAIGILDDKEP